MLPILKEKIPAPSPKAPSQKLASGLLDIDYFIDGGLAFNQLTEWGIPWGSGGRSLILFFLAEATKRGYYSLWVYDRKDLLVYPPSWQAIGVDLKYLRVAVTSQVEKTKNAFTKTKKRGIYTKAIEDLKPALMSPFFKVIIIDSHIAPQDYAFLAQRARLQKQLIFVLRKHHLSSRMGNVWAKCRFNSFRDPLSGRCYLRALKGYSQRQMSYTLHGGAL